MTFGDRTYLESEYIPQVVGHSNAPAQAAIAAAWRAAYFHGQQNAVVVLEQPPTFNVRDFTDDATVQRTIIPSAAAFAGIARGYRRLPRDQNVLRVTVMFAPRSVNHLRATFRVSCYAIAEDETDILVVGPRNINEGATGGRFQGVNGVFGGNNNRAAAVAGSVGNPFTAGFDVRTEQFELPLVNVPITGGVRVRVLVEMRCNQQNDAGAFNVPVHVQVVGVLVHAESRR